MEEDGFPQDVVRELAILKCLAHDNIIRYKYIQCGLPSNIPVLHHIDWSMFADLVL